MTTATTATNPASLFHVTWRIDTGADSAEDAATDMVAQFFKHDCPVEQLIFQVKESDTDEPAVEVDAFSALIDGNAPSTGVTKEYKVSFTQTIVADSPEQAAREIYQIFFTQEHQANAFHVRKDGEDNEVLIDFCSECE